MKAYFKKLPVAMRDHLHELTGSELKVWMYLYLRSDKDDTAFPSNKTIAKATGVHPDRVPDAKKGLRAKGWLGESKQLYRSDGSKSSAEEKCLLPPQQNAGVEGDKMSGWGAGQIVPLPTGTKRPGHEVDVVSEVAPSTSSSSIQGEANTTTTTDPVVDVVSASPEKERENQEQLTIAGYTPEEIQEHVAKFPEGSWVQVNATSDALRRPGFVRHVMGLEPPRRPRRAARPGEANQRQQMVDGKPLPAYRQESGKREILASDL